MVYNEVMGKRWSFFLVFFLFSASLSGAESLIGRPLPSLECRELLKQRNAKVFNQQKLTALIVRNKKVQEKLPETKKILREKLHKNLVRLKQELHYVRDAIKYREEKLIRRGCPSVDSV